MYSEFSKVYDALMGDVDYPQRTEYLLSLFKKFDRLPTLLLDLACGTGGFSNEFASRGINVIGVDMSAEMLTKANENSKALGLDVLYLCQNAADLDLYGTVDGAICCLDSINHITDYDELCQVFKKVSLFLERDRLFIFDVNTVYKHEVVLGDNTFVLEEDNIFCVWDNSYEEETRTVQINLDFFCEDSNGKYIRTSDYIEEKAYTYSELGSLLTSAGFSIEAVYSELTQNPPQDDTQRVIYVARKVK